MALSLVAMDVLPLIDRAKMPQIDPNLYADMFVYLGAKGLTFEAGLMSPDLIHLHQEVDVDIALALPSETLNKAILISEDNFVFDGDHRAYRHLHDGTQVPFIRIKTPFDQGLTLLLSFPGVYSDTRV